MHSGDVQLPFQHLSERPSAGCLRFIEFPDTAEAGGRKRLRFTKSARAIEKYCCNFGLNPGYREQLEDAGLEISGSDQGGETRIMEFPRHPFFLGTLFVPQANSTRENPHPIVRRFLQVAAECAMSGPLSGGGLRSTHQSAV